VRSGVRREGSFFGVNALLTKPAQSVALALSPFILEATQFVTREANRGQMFLNQPASAVFGMKVIAGLIPGIAMFLGAIILIWYPLRGTYLESVQQKVLEMHSEKGARLAEMQAEEAEIAARPAIL
jgi:glycoside/pentoside/hexuronide:cation symporter, GPH family